MSPFFTMHARIVEHGPQTLFEHLFFWSLWPCSCLYGLIVRLRRALYRCGLKTSCRASIPVISIGNLTAGGTGKTPMADFLAKRLVERGETCAIISRGYRGSFSGTVGRVNGDDGSLLMNPESCGDEPCLLARRNPGARVYVARRRADGVKRAEEDGATVVLLEDGFQHLAVARDLNILLLDARAPFGNRHLLPAGILREPVEAIHDSDLIVLTRAPESLTVDLPAVAPVLCCRHQLSEFLTDSSAKQISLHDLVEKRCLAFAGIARPEPFFTSLRQAGLNKLTELPLADHQQYTADILARIRKACDNHDVLITTEKDAVKLIGVDFPLPCLQIGVDLVFSHTDPLDQMIDTLMEPVS